MTDVPHPSASRPLPWLLLGLAGGLLLSFAGIGLLKDGVEPAPDQRAALPAPVQPADPQRSAALLEAERERAAAQLAEAEAAWSRQLEAARTGTEAARQEAVQELDRIYQAELARLAAQHASELERVRAAAAAAVLAAAAPAISGAPAAHEAPAADLAPSAQTFAAEPASQLERARSAEVALALGPFLEPGYAQLDNTFSADPLPFSYAQLIATGALAAEPEGWRTLYKIGSSRRDRSRTRWPADPDAEDLVAAQRAQELLQELGPALVEIGVLRP